MEVPIKGTVTAEGRLTGKRYHGQNFDQMVSTYTGAGGSGYAGALVSEIQLPGGGRSTMTGTPWGDWP